MIDQTFSIHLRISESKSCFHDKVINEVINIREQEIDSKDAMKILFLQAQNNKLRNDLTMYSNTSDYDKEKQMFLKFVYKTTTKEQLISNKIRKNSARKKIMQNLGEIVQIFYATSYVLRQSSSNNWKEAMNYNKNQKKRKYSNVASLGDFDQKTIDIFLDKALTKLLPFHYITLKDF